MNKSELSTVQEQIREELAACIRFWVKHGADTVHGGVYTCLDREGNVYSTDKSVWMQGRCAWTFSRLCNQYGEKEEWRRLAKSCLDFLETHCINREAGNRMFFTTTAEGKPLRQRRYCFSEGFYCLANAEYYALSGEDEYLQHAQDAYELIWQLNNGLIKDPAGLAPKTMMETRKGRSLADPMIYLNISNILLKYNPGNAKLYLSRAKACADIILNLHYKPELEATLETVGMNGEFWEEISAGRVVNPGHDMECAWFLLEYAQASGDKEAEEKAKRMFSFAYKNGWDDEYGGLFYFIDVLGNPPEAYEHDMKLWWPHNEMLISSLMLYQHTLEKQYLDLFLQAWKYSRDVFADKEYGEWYGYLRRDGKPTEPTSKGTTFKGPFHLPRMLMMADEILSHLLGGAAPVYWQYGL